MFEVVADKRVGKHFSTEPSDGNTFAGAGVDACDPCSSKITHA